MKSLPYSHFLLFLAERGGGQLSPSFLMTDVTRMSFVDIKRTKMPPMTLTIDDKV